MPQTNREAALARYAAGEPLRHIADCYNVVPGTITIWRRRAGLPPRHTVGTMPIYDESGIVVAWSVTQAAEILGVARPNVYRYLMTWGDGWRIVRRPTRGSRHAQHYA